MIAGLSPKKLFVRTFTTCALLFVTLIVMGVVRESRMQPRYERATGLASVAQSRGVAFNNPAALWESRSLVRTAAFALSPSQPGYSRALASFLPEGADSTSERKIVRSARLFMIVQNPRQTAERISQLSGEMGGYTVRLQVVEDEQQQSAAISIRVPASQLEQARNELRKISLRVESDNVETEEVSKRYIDYQATLRNYRAAEQQYLTIMQRAQKVPEILEVTDKLYKVRGDIEQTEGELRQLQQQIAMAALAITLRAESYAQTTGTRWRPGYALKRSFRAGLDNLAGYAETMTVLVMNLPAILLWAVTILLCVKFGWTGLRRFWRGLTDTASIPQTRPSA